MKAEQDQAAAKEQWDELQAQGLNQLSTNEREQVFYEIHGVADVIPEDDPTFVTAKLIEFDVEIDRLLEFYTASAAYNQAASSSLEYVKKTEFRLLFLRGDAFDVGTAAGRMISYFQQKLELFGPDKLTKDITLQDYDEDDLKCLKTGCSQTLPIRDRSGRAVLCHVPCLLGKDHCFTMQSRLRALWYVYNSMIENIDVQRYGFVCVNYGVGFMGQFNKDTMKIPKLVKALPVRGQCLHLCYNSSRWQMLTRLTMLVGGKRARTHLRVHFGTHKEVQSKLGSFGIPCDGEVFPIGLDGQPRIHTRWLKLVAKWQKRDEKALMVQMDITTQIVPGPNDVLLGRQKVYVDHSGNIHLRITVNKFRDEYDSTKGRLGKTGISNKIVRMIKENNGRFLKMDDDSGCWIEVDDMMARDKVAHTFRNQRINMSVESSSKKKQPPTQQQHHQQQLSKVRLRASESVEGEYGLSTVQPSKKRQRMEGEGGPSMTADDDDDDHSVGSTSSWLGSFQGVLRGMFS